ncbi:MAG: thioredoxin family protein [archaeon]
MVLLESNNELQPGDKAPDFSLPGIDDKTHSLFDFAGKPALIIFMCNHCPYVIDKFETINGLAKRFPDIAVIGINPNDAHMFPEDSFENMKRIADEEGFVFTYLFDENQEVAEAYGAVCTPDPFLFDKDGKLFFHGRLNDSMSPGDTVSEETMADAIGALLVGKEIAAESKPSRGCSIKWR